MRFLALCLIVLLGWPLAVDAACRIRQVVKQEVAVVAPAVVATYAAIPVYVPAYSVGYSAGAVSYNPEAAVELPAMKAPCEDELADLKARLAILEAKAGGVSVTAKAPEASMLVQKCAACHDAAVSKTKGKGLSLTAAGKDLPLAPEVRLKCIEQLVSGTMPKDGPALDDDTLTAMIAYLSAKK